MKKSTQVFVRISPQLKARFDRVCRKNFLNQSALMRSWIEEFVKKELPVVKVWYITPKKGADLADRFGEFALLDADAACVVVEADEGRKVVQSCAFDEHPVTDRAYANADKWDEWDGDFDETVAELEKVFGDPDEVREI